MSCKIFLIVTLSLFSLSTLVSPQRASADTPLTRATVQALRNQVQLIFKNRVTRAARNADTMTPGDSLATARQSFAELRFNDSSLARIGERALFQFVPNTRNFYLGNGTALLLIPPGQGRTNVRTPNAAAGIRGSALFVRYNEDTNTTIVGALTNSRIEVTNGDNPQAQTLKAGQMAVIIQNQLVQIYNFDLNTFYRTSELVKDLDLPLSSSIPSADPGIAAVQAETSQAVREQAPLRGQVSENPTFVSLTPPPNVQTAVTPTPLTTTPSLSGFDRDTPKRTILPNTSPPSPPDARPIVPGGPTLPNPENTTASPPASSTLPPATSPAPIEGTTTPRIPAPVQPTLPVPPQTSPAPSITPGTTPPATPAPTSGITPPVQPPIQVPPPSTPAPTTSPTVTPPVQTPIQVPPPSTPAPTTSPIVTPSVQTPIQVIPPSTPAPTISPVVTPPVQTPILVTPPSTPAPTISPIVTPPVQTPILVTPPSTPAPTISPVVTPPVQTPILVTPPSTPAPATPAPATPAPTLSITAPAPRPAPALTPTVLTPAPASSVQLTTTTTSAVGTSGLQTTIVTPVIVTPALTVPGQ